MKRRQVLLFPAGTEIGLEIAQALRHCKEVDLHAAGQPVSNHAPFVHATYHHLPGVLTPGWDEELMRLCRRLAIDYIFPCHDDVIVALARVRTALPATVLTAPAETCETTRLKSATYRTLAGVVPVPAMYADVAAVPAYPVIVKPDRGQGSFGVVRAANRDDALAAAAALPDPLLCEYLPGAEYTVDCFSDRERGLLYARARTRQRTRAGIAVNTCTVDHLPVEPLARAINARLPFHGAWFFQLKESASGVLTLLEAAPRIAGSMALHRVRGVNFPLLSMFEHERLPLVIQEQSLAVELDRAFGNRYRHRLRYDVLYIDLDDTLLMRGQVNLQALTLIFQCINAGKAVHLLSRHAGDLGATLARHRLDRLFDSVHHLRDGMPKSACIRASNAIFVDDSFSERKEVAEALGIPTFDCSMIELLTEQSPDPADAEAHRHD